MTDDVCEVVITAPDSDWLMGFARRLVDDRLCAGGHSIERIRSVYWWQGEVHDEPEARIALHTRRELVAAVVRRVKAEHPYEVPCVIALPVRDGDVTYLRWVIEETRDPADHPEG